MSNQQGSVLDKFRSLHVPGHPLVLANAWDAASAVLVQRIGFEAVATTSGGVAWACGRPDGNRISANSLLAAIDQIRAVVILPLTVDIEAGLSSDSEDPLSLISELAERGIAGFNLEDSWESELLPESVQKDRIIKARSAAKNMFLNARVDAFFFGSGDDEDRLEEAIARASVFIEAGADGIFVPGLLDLGLIRELVTRVDAPINILAGPGGPTVSELVDVGVARISLGTVLAEAAYSRVNDIAQKFRSSGVIDPLSDSLSYPGLNAMFDQ